MNYPRILPNFFLAPSYLLNSTINTLVSVTRGLAELVIRVARYFSTCLTSLIDRYTLNRNEPPDYSHLVDLTKIRFYIDFRIEGGPPIIIAYANLLRSYSLKHMMNNILAKDHPSINFLRENYGRDPQNFMFTLICFLNNQEGLTVGIPVQIPLFLDDTRTSIIDGGFHPAIDTVAEFEKDPHIVATYGMNSRCRSITLAAHSVLDITENGRRPSLAHNTHLRKAWMMTVARGIIRANQQI